MSQDTQSQPAQSHEYQDERNPGGGLAGIFVSKAPLGPFADDRSCRGREDDCRSDHQQNAQQMDSGGSAVAYSAMAETAKKSTVEHRQHAAILHHGRQARTMVYWLGPREKSKTILFWPDAGAAKVARAMPPPGCERRLALTL